jgi:hypothetical protein
MHGNIVRTAGGVKTRRFDDVMAELEGFFATCRAEGAWPGGVHLEFTGDDVGDSVERRAALAGDVTAPRSLDEAFDYVASTGDADTFDPPQTNETCAPASSTTSG